MYVPNKKHFLVWTAAVSLILLYSACVTPDDREDKAVAASSEQSDKSEKECRYLESTGSRMRRSSICLTREEWARVDERKRELDENQEKEADEFFRKAIESSGRMGGTGLSNPNSPSP